MDVSGAVPGGGPSAGFITAGDGYKAHMRIAVIGGA